MHGHFFRDENGRVRVFRVVWIAIGGVMLAGLLAIGLGWLVQYLWNHTVSVLFQWPTISYWQAVGLFLLGKLLFGGMGHGGHGGKHGHSHRKGRGCGRGRWNEDWDWEDDYEHFHKYWENEGKAAYRAYVDRMKQS